MKKLAIYSVLFSTTLFAQTATGPQILPSGSQTVTPTTTSFNAADYFTGKSVSGPSNADDVTAAVGYLNNIVLNPMTVINPVAVDKFINNVFSGTTTNALRYNLIYNLTGLSSMWLGDSVSTLTSKMLPSEFEIATDSALAKLAPATSPEKALQVAPLLGLSNHPGKEDSFLLGMIFPSDFPLVSMIAIASNPKSLGQAGDAVNVLTTIAGNPNFGAYTSQVRGAINSLQKNAYITSAQKAALNKLLPPPNATDNNLFVPTQRNTVTSKERTSTTILPKPQ